jgi:hypothetical protein
MVHIVVGSQVQLEVRVYLQMGESGDLLSAEEGLGRRWRCCVDPAVERDQAALTVTSCLERDQLHRAAAVGEGRDVAAVAGSVLVATTAKAAEATTTEQQHLRLL